MGNQLQDVMGALEQMGINYNPEERQQAQTARDTAYQRYGALSQMPITGATMDTPREGVVGRLLENYLANYDPRDVSNTGFIRALGRAPGVERELQKAELGNQLKFAGSMAENAQQDYKEADNREKNFIGAMKTHRDSQAKQDSALRAMMNNAEITARAIADKQSGNMTPDQHQALYIQTRQNLLRDALGNAVAIGAVSPEAASAAMSGGKLPETSPVEPTAAPASGIKSYGTPADILDRLRGVESSGDPYAINKQTKAVGQYQFLPETVAMLHKQGMKFDPFDPEQSRAAADFYIQQLAKQNGGDMNKALAAYGGFKNADPTAYVSKINGVNPTAAPQPAFTTPNQQKLAYEQAKVGTTQQIEGAQKQYDDYVATPASRSDSVIQAMTQMEAMPYETGKLNPIKEQVGGLMDAFGLDGKLARNATDTQTLTGVINGLVNSRMDMAKGVQAKDDEKRVRAELLSLGDTDAAFKYKIALIKELAMRDKVKNGVYLSSAEKTGDHRQGQRAWDATGLVNLPSVQIVNGKPVGFHQFSADARKLHPNASDADLRETWMSYLSRGGKK